ncbi:MAG: 30S ribosomal protein S6 [Candidatus Blackburnbacteria bacterium RIFCSPHIGHO2_01_FULL_44_64]|uniref:Small ribosomal subunit protein bS6 n=1 Tax=Candidatus Blackburnbacteria bacterium RIFCSPHIGHO2_02_FULL_44_20 TaxID=1797516 RepID=A0A1G1V7U2_9BACT|nr:MAG: 30S ribosomal protein S6 [Candidatus Blackburnbacteria bacterium RIFCSPHIGHO2_01_FULL_44_64]OGY11198.1 MAG: 30S ribosomal protein S6 [Candidatus Blackburnbacteria bacterium RIFCSPHIGHO2_12_FULL_44_25]OGY11485.1 MAG: 30S ribosomal protein S6 [Candidatus Blackburnbacteria bacterium RIFCSPHIGHO2_02_FULL_44_20]OGY15168.1 MAG: 30S ribosomal protein S6 [Candidatus Blackburnbacteria bacterium RIFCSPLOWO2_01_FULL_44_43]OGY17552.1 MAG: 30S ribosomal protein S6 [Candidatus Blackburnbacteria bacte
MKNYELTLILADLPAGRQEKTLDKIGKLASYSGGKVVNTTSWGKKDLFYPIKKVASGVYYFLDLALPSEAAPVVNRELEIDDDVLRHLLVVAEKVTISKSKVLNTESEVVVEKVKEEKVEKKPKKTAEKVVKRTRKKG